MDAAVLRNDIRGEVLEQSGPGYDAAMTGMLWNQLRTDRWPDLIVRVRDAQDVIKAVKFADSNGMRVVVRAAVIRGAAWRCAAAEC